VYAVRPRKHHNCGVKSGRHACRYCVWPVILGAELYTTCRGERVLVVIRFNVTFLYLWGPITKKCVLFSWKMQKV